MRPRENDVTAKLIKVLNSIPLTRAKKRHGGKFQSGEPDIAAVFRGRAVLIEVKLIDGELTRLQAAELDRWAAAGAFCAVAVWNHAQRVFSIHRDRILESWQALTGAGTLNKEFNFGLRLGLTKDAWTSLLEESCQQQD